MMKEEKFKVIQFIRDFILAVEKEMENFPKKDVELKDRIRRNSYDILEIAYEANMTQDIENKKELIFKMMAKAKIIDFLLNLSYDKKLITEKKFYKLGMRLEDIIKYATGWFKNIKN